MCSADTRTLAVNRTSSSFGDRTFAAAAHTRVWNSLPPDLRQSGLSYVQFRRSLKTFLFGQWDHGAVWTLLTAPSRSILTYLLSCFLYMFVSTVSQFVMFSIYLRWLELLIVETNAGGLVWTKALQFVACAQSWWGRSLGSGETAKPLASNCNRRLRYVSK